MKYEEKTIKHYEKLMEKIKKYTKEVEDMKQTFIKDNGGESDESLVLIKDNFRENVAGKDIFAQKFNPEFLEVNGLINKITFKTIVIAKKATTQSEQKAG